MCLSRERGLFNFYRDVLIFSNTNGMKGFFSTRRGRVLYIANIIVYSETSQIQYHLTTISSCALSIRLNKDAFQVHLYQTVDTFVENNDSRLMSPLRKRRPSQLIEHLRNT